MSEHFLKVESLSERETDSLLSPTFEWYTRNFCCHIMKEVVVQESQPMFFWKNVCIERLFFRTHILRIAQRVGLLSRRQHGHKQDQHISPDFLQSNVFCSTKFLTPFIYLTLKCENASKSTPREGSTIVQVDTSMQIDRVPLLSGYNPQFTSSDRVLQHYSWTLDQYTAIIPVHSGTWHAEALWTCVDYYNMLTDWYKVASLNE